MESKVLLDLLKSRHSERKQIKGVITDEQIQYLKDAINTAPSSQNRNDASAIIITDQKIKDAYFEKLGHNPRQQMVQNNSALIVFLADPTRTHIAEEVLEREVEKHNPENLFQAFGDAFILATTASIAANALGFGVVFLGSARLLGIPELMKEYYNLPEDVVPVIALAIGHIQEGSKNHFSRLNRVYINEYDKSKIKDEVLVYDKHEKEFWTERELDFDYFNNLLKTYGHDTSHHHEHLFKKYFEKWFK